jgi:Na+/melibiose symporter-like transporter
LEKEKSNKKEKMTKELSPSSSSPPYQIVLWSTMALTALLVARSFANKKNQNSTTSAAKGTTDNDMERSFLQFRNRYLLVYLLMVAGDWLQGPYVYSLYSTYGFSKGDIAVLFVIGFGASMLVGTMVGSLADSNGRKKFCLLYCALYIGSCATKHVNDYWVLLLGRLLGGTATSLLFSVFESWLVCAHNARGYGEEKLGEVFSLQIFGNSIVAIASGVVAQAAADAFPMSEGPLIHWGGYTGPFDLAAIILVIGGVILASTWEENFGERQDSQFSTQALSQGFKLIFTNKAVLLCGLVQSLFEGAMYSFVFEWTPALTPEGSKPPYGTIFATFMVCCMAGSQLVGKALSNGRSPQDALPYVFLLSAVGLGCVPLDAALGTGLSFYGMLLFEMCVGLYFPLISMMKSTIVPEQHRSTMYNIFRVPLNAIVLFVLLNNFNVETTFMLCVFLLLVAFVLQLTLIKTIQSNKMLAATDDETVSLQRSDLGEDK